MARPLKKGIDYFSHDVNMNHDIKIKLLKAKYGLTGYAIYNLLLEDIYKQGYYLEINEDYILIFCSENSIDTESFNNILEFMLSRSLFSEVIYSNHRVLTSKRIQENYLEATYKRKYNNVILDIYSVNSELTTIKSELTKVNDGLNTQSKVKESKVNKSKELTLFINSEYYDYDKFRIKFLSNDNYKQYDVKYYYEAVKNWSAGKGEMRKDWIAVGRNFALTDKTPRMSKNGNVETIKLPD